MIRITKGKGLNSPLAKQNFLDAEKGRRSQTTGLILILGALSAFGPLTIDMYLPGFPMLTQELTTTESLTQLSLTACLFGLAFGQILVGPLSDVHGRRKPLIIALSFYVIASSLCAFAPSISILILLRFIQGAAGAAGLVISRACVRDVYSNSEMTKIFSLLVLVMGIAPIVAPILGGFLLNFVSWRGVFVALGVLGLLMLLVIIFKLPETLPKDKRANGGSKQMLSNFQVLLRNRAFVGFILTMGCTSGALFAYISGSSFVFQEVFGVSPQVFGFIFAFNASGYIIASQITGRLAGKANERFLLGIGIGMFLTGGLLLLAFIFLGAGLIPVMIGVFIVISSIGLINSTAMSLAMGSQGKQLAGSASALIGMAQFTIGGIMAPVVGLAGSDTALPMGITIGSCGFGALMIYVFLVRKEAALKKQRIIA
jgi:DHA1 family bicyclomycin/chloramphenicol resistance-like MFS transporter